MATVLTRLAFVARIVEQPPFWGGVAAALAVKGGTRGQQVALRGSVCYVVAAFIANIVIKPLVYRRRPQGAGEGRITPYTSSFRRATPHQTAPLSSVWRRSCPCWRFHSQPRRPHLTGL